jgi:hypothetical protein
LARAPLSCKFWQAIPFLVNFGAAYPFVSGFWPDPALRAVILLCAVFFVEISSFHTLQVPSGFAIRAVRE